MFKFSKFNKDISNWNVSKVTSMIDMFAESEFNQDISNWNVSHVKNFCDIFMHSKFNQDLTSWKNKIKNKSQLKYIQNYIK